MRWVKRLIEVTTAKEVQAPSQSPPTQPKPERKKTRFKKQPVAFEQIASIPATQQDGQPSGAMARSKSTKVSKRLSGAFHEIWPRQQDRGEQAEEQKVPSSGRLTPSKTRFADDPNAKEEAPEPPSKGTGLGRAMSMRLPLRSKSTRKATNPVEKKEIQSTKASSTKSAEVTSVDATPSNKSSGLGRALSLRSFSRPRPRDAARPSTRPGSRQRTVERANIAAIIEEPAPPTDPGQEKKGHQRAGSLKFRRQGAKSNLSIRATPAQYAEALAKQKKTAEAQEKPGTSKWRFWKA